MKINLAIPYVSPPPPTIDVYRYRCKWLIKPKRIQLCPIIIEQKCSRTGVPGSNRTPTSRSSQGRNQPGKHPSSLLRLTWRHWAVNSVSWMAEWPQILVASPLPIKRSRVYRKGNMVIVRAERARNVTVPQRRSLYRPTNARRITLKSRADSSSWLKAYSNTSKKENVFKKKKNLHKINGFNTVRRGCSITVTWDPWKVSTGTYGETCLDTRIIQTEHEGDI